MRAPLIRPPAALRTVTRSPYGQYVTTTWGDAPVITEPPPGVVGALSLDADYLSLDADNLTLE